MTIINNAINAGLPISVANGGTGNAGPFTTGSILYSNGTIITQDNVNLNWNDTVKTFTVIQPSSVATLNTVLYVESDPAGVHGHGNHIEIAGNPGGGGTIFRTDGGLNKSVLQLYGGDYTGTTGGGLYLNGNNSTSGDAGGVQTTFGLSTSTFDMYDYTQSILLFQVNNTGVLKLPGVTASRALATDASNNVVASATTATELSYVSGVTSSIQAQINALSGGLVWNVVTINTAMVANNGYINNSASLITYTLPTTIAAGTVLRVAGYGTGLWAIAQNAGQVINFGDLSTTTGTGGSLAATNQGDSLEMVCVVANTTFVIISVVGNITII